MSDLETKLRELHAHVCPERNNGHELCDCSADENDSHEVGVCAAWDAIRDAARLGAEDRQTKIVAWLRRRGVLPTESGRGSYGANPYILDAADALEREDIK